METDEPGPAETSTGGALGSGGLAACWVALGVMVPGVAFTFANAGGWLTPGKLTGARIIDTFQAVAGWLPLDAST